MQAGVLVDRIIPESVGERVPWLMSLLLSARGGRYLRKRDLDDPAMLRQAEGEWVRAKPNPGLTWGVELQGDAFATKVAEYGGFGPDKILLEIGPGYGRIARACMQYPHREYHALDLSPSNAAWLREALPGATIWEGSAAETRLPVRYDTVLSSLTFKHIYPSFEPSLANLASQMNPGGLVVIDLIEGWLRYFSRYGMFMRFYSRDEVREILQRVGLQLVAFDNVTHAPNYDRLLVVARKPD